EECPVAFSGGGDGFLVGWAPRTERHRREDDGLLVEGPLPDAGDAAVDEDDGGEEAAAGVDSLRVRRVEDGAPVGVADEVLVEGGEEVRARRGLAERRVVFGADEVQAFSCFGGAEARPPAKVARGGGPAAPKVASRELGERLVARTRGRGGDTL